jgi:hypothetical protein
MKLTIDPMASMKSKAEELINRYFDTIAFNRAHRDQVHVLKKQEAIKVAAGESSKLLSEEALLLGSSESALAETILAKPDELAGRELVRRRAIVGVRKATSPDNLTKVLGQFSLRLEE